MPLYAVVGREGVRAGAVTAGKALVLATGISLTALPAFALAPDEARHLLARTGFDAQPQAIADLAPHSREAAVASLLDGAGRVAVTPPPVWTADWTPPKRLRDLDEAERSALREERRHRARELKAWWYREMLDSPTPVTEVMTLFWHNHFTSGLKKVKSPILMYRQNVTLRRHALGNFAELLRAMARDPAMLVYLDGARSKKDAPNENFARELLELFTLGEGHYGEADIKAAARAFTGWSLDRKTGQFALRRRWHDDGRKSFLGRSGRFDGDDILAILPGPSAHRRAGGREALARLHFGDARCGRGAAPGRPLPRRRLRDHAPAPGPANQRGLLRSAGARAPGQIAGRPAGRHGAPVSPSRSRKPRTSPGSAGASARTSSSPPNVKGWPGGTAWITSETLLLRQALLSRGHRLPRQSRQEPAAVSGPPTSTPGTRPWRRTGGPAARSPGCCCPCRPSTPPCSTGTAAALSSAACCATRPIS